MNFMQLLDPLSATIVIGGTLAATLLRCGWRDARAALVMLAQLPRRPFDSDRVRAELAAQVREIDKEGILRAEPHRFGDGEFDDLSEALIRRRSITALFEKHERHRERRQATAHTAARVLSEAAELAPVIGLAGTLFALGSYSTAVDGDYARSIGTAVVTTLHGLVLANFVFAPLVGGIERHARAEESERKRLLDWLAAAIERTVPARGGGGESRAAA
ncbi:MotA/TolQ/ExbB proton channel family protein [Leptolyngbya sp. 15MV]|nr:MotA/TolQ/ExbB proton channel family protein [Leptolyngbya sp. 15MV]